MFRVIDYGFQSPRNNFETCRHQSLSPNDGNLRATLGMTRGIGSALDNDFIMFTHTCHSRCFPGTSGGFVGSNTFYIFLNVK